MSHPKAEIKYNRVIIKTIKGMLNPNSKTMQNKPPLVTVSLSMALVSSPTIVPKTVPMIRCFERDHIHIPFTIASYFFFYEKNCHQFNIYN